MNSNVIEVTVPSGPSGPPVRVVEVLVPRGGTTAAGAAEALRAALAARCGELAAAARAAIGRAREEAG